MDAAGIAASVAAKGLDPAAREGAAVAGGLIRNLFGPVTEQMGDDLLEKYKNRNVQRVVDRSYRKRPDGEGSIPPRLGANVFDAASYADDEIVVEYLSGVLASSKTPEGKDDAGIAWSALISRLPVAHLRLHFALYSTAAHHLHGLAFDGLHEFESHPIWAPLLPLGSFLSATDWETSFNDAIINIQREGLIGPVDIAGDGAKILARYGKEADTSEPAIRFCVSPPGVQLYLWGIGHGKAQALAFAQFEEPSGDLPCPIPIPGSCRFGDLSSVVRIGE